MLPSRVFVQVGWQNSAIYGLPGLLTQRQIRFDKIVPLFSPFESEHKQAEKFISH